MRTRQTDGFHQPGLMIDSYQRFDLQQPDHPFAFPSNAPAFLQIFERMRRHQLNHALSEVIGIASTASTSNMPEPHELLPIPETQTNGGVFAIDQIYREVDQPGNG